jgi:beta-phosphoglucomutase-like phosphatase (HAD superfamily)
MGESRLQALIFDVDGTLAETEHDGHRVAFNRAFGEAGLDWTWDEATYARLLAVTGGRERILEYMAELPSDERPAGDPASLAARLHARKTAIFQEMLREGRIPLRPGVERLLREARMEGLRLAIATTTTAGNVEALLEANLGPESLGWFEVIAAADLAPVKKPAPDVFHVVLERMSLAPGDCIAIEDSRNGLRAALRAGVPVLVTVSHYTRGEDFTGALVVLDHLGELDRPVRVLQGDLDGFRYVDVAALRWLHGRAAASAA